MQKSSRVSWVPGTLFLDMRTRCCNGGWPRARDGALGRPAWLLLHEYVLGYILVILFYYTNPKK